MKINTHNKFAVTTTALAALAGVLLSACSSSPPAKGGGPVGGVVQATSSAAAPPVGAEQSAVTTTGQTTFTNVTQMSNLSPTQTLGKIGHNSTAHPWFSCAYYHKIMSPTGPDSAYPFGPDTWTWKLNSPNKLLTATELNSDRTGPAKIQISFVNAATYPQSASVNFDCSSLFPGFGITGMQIQSVDHITSTTANITWKLGVTVLGESNIATGSTWHVEYGSADGDYSTVSALLPYDSQGPHGADPRSITLTGLQPGTTYHFRIALDVKAYGDFGNLQTSYSDPNNNLTTAASQ